MSRIYFDNAATTPLDPEVLDAMMPYLTEKFGNPSSVYSYGRETKMAVELARKSVAQNLNAHPSEIFFTSGGTESNNTAIHTSVRDLGCRRIITSSIEHHAVGYTIDFINKEGLAKVDYVKLLPNGHIDLHDLERLLSDSGEKTLVSLMHGNNEIGNVLDLNQVGGLCEKFKAIFHSDTVQTVGHFPFDLRNTPVHFITGASHKFHGPKGIGLLYINENVRIKPLLFGGGQERNMRAGTENVYGIVGFSKALELSTVNHESDKKYINAVRLYMYDELKKNLPQVSFNGDVTGSSLYTVLSVNFPKSEKSELLLFNLDIQNICASIGSACASGVEEGSHVISAINPGSNHVTVRFSFSKYNTQNEVDQVIEKIKNLL